MKQPHERGELGAWLVAQRRRLSEERGIRVTQQVVVDGLAEQGYPIDASYYRAIESGSKKTAGLELREALARYFGRTPPAPSTAGTLPGGDVGRLVAAIEAQTAAIDRLVAIAPALSYLIEKVDDIRANQDVVAQTVPAKLIEALAPAERLEAVERLARRLESPPQPSDEESDDPPDREDQGAEVRADPESS